MLRHSWLKGHFLNQISTVRSLFSLFSVFSINLHWRQINVQTIIHSVYSSGTRTYHLNHDSINKSTTNYLDHRLPYALASIGTSMNGFMPGKEPFPALPADSRNTYILWRKHQWSLVNGVRIFDAATTTTATKGCFSQRNELKEHSKGRSFGRLFCSG